MIELSEKNFASVGDFLIAWKAHRLANKNKWIVCRVMLHGCMVEIKQFNTWMQVFRINGYNFPNLMDQPVCKYEAHLKSTLARVINA